MNIRRKISLLLLTAVFGVFSVTGCDTVGNIDMSSSSSSDSVLETVSADENSTEPSSEAVNLYPDYPITYPEIQPQDIGEKYEAENCILNGLQTSDTRKGYSGSGYVTGFSDDSVNTLSFSINAPSNQHYDLSFCIASETSVGCTVMLNGSEISRFETKPDESGAFTIITLYGVFLVSGETEISVTANGGNIDLDYLGLSNNTTLKEISYDANGELSNENAAKSAKELMGFLSENYGKYIITGQYASDESNSELELIYKTTGKYPAIRFSLFRNSGDSFDDCMNTINAAADWYNNGGIVGLMWYWEAPGDKPSVYAKDTDFKLSEAVTETDMANLSQEELRKLCSEGVISEACYEIILDIDNMSGQLLTLKNKGIPVLWRPLHEGSGYWYWWGAQECGVEAYKWLWNLMYTRMTEYFSLDNLIWVWNGQSVDTLVDKNTFDIAAMDIYIGEGKEYGSRYEQFAALQKLVGSDKLIALSECSSVPDIDASFRDNAVWSFFGLWYGKYLQDENGGYSEAFMSRENFIRAYNSSGALTLDEYKAMKNGTFEDKREESSDSSSAEETTAQE